MLDGYDDDDDDYDVYGIKSNAGKVFCRK